MNAEVSDVRKRATKTEHYAIFSFARCDCDASPTTSVLF